MTRNREPKHPDLILDLATYAQDGTQKVLLELSIPSIRLNSSSLSPKLVLSGNYV